MSSSRSLAGAGVAQAVAAPHSVTDTPGVTYEQVRQRIVNQASEVGVTYSDAARELRVTVPTIRAWVARGVLEEAEGMRIHAVTASSLGRVISVLDRLDAQQLGRGRLMELAEEIRNRELLDAAQRAHRAEGGGRRFAEVTDEEMEAL